MRQTAAQGYLPSLYNPTDKELAEMEREKAQTQQGQTTSQAGNIGMQGGMMPPPPPSIAEYFVFSNNVQTGPFSLQQIQQQVTMGAVTKQTYVWKQGMAGWALAESVPEVAALFATTTPPPPPIMM